MFLQFGRDRKGFQEIRDDGSVTDISFAKRTKDRLIIVFIPSVLLTLIGFALYLTNAFTTSDAELILIPAGLIFGVRVFAALWNAIWGLASNRSFYKTCTILYGLLCILPVWMIIQDLSVHYDWWDGFMAFLGLIGLGVLSVPLLLHGILWHNAVKRERRTKPE